MAAAIHQVNPLFRDFNGPTHVCPINQLDNALLRQIFWKLRPADRLTAEEVCRRWRAVAKLSWTNVRCLDFTKSSTGITDFDHMPRIHQSIYRVAKMILRCRRYLEVLKLGTFCHYTMIPFVITHCKILQRLEISMYQDGVTSGRIPKMERLQYFRLENINSSGGGLFQALRCEILTELHLRGATFGYDGEDDGYRTCMPFSSQYELQGLRNLRVLTFCYLDLKPAMQKIINQNFDLISLSIANCNLDGNFFMDALVNLEHLDLKRVLAVDDLFLSDLVGTCRRLKSLKIDHCYEITDEGMFALLVLPQLEDLSVNHILSVTDYPFSGMCSLRRLSCEGCENVEDYEIITLIKTAANLEYLNVKWTSVSHKVLTEANDATKRRTNSTSLHIVISNYVYEAWLDNNDSPLLVVESCDGINPRVWSREPGQLDEDDFCYPPDFEFEYNYGSDSGAEEYYDCQAKFL